MARLLTVPESVQGFNTTISQLLQDAKTQASTLLQNPSDPTSLAILERDLSMLSSQFNIVVTFISGAVTNIQTVQNKLPDMAVQLQSIATKSTQDAKVDQGKIDQLNKDIDGLQAEIKSLTTTIVATNIAEGIALTVGVVVTIAFWPIGAIAWLFLGPAVAAGALVITLSATKLQAAQAKLDSDKSQMDQLTATVATLHILAKTYNDMANQVQETENNLKEVLKEWQTLESDLNAAITDIKTAMADEKGTNFNAVLNDLKDAINEWNAAYAQAGALHLDLQVNNAPLKVGMSDSEVQAAINNGQNVGVMNYYNNPITAAA